MSDFAPRSSPDPESEPASPDTEGSSSPGPLGTGSAPQTPQPPLEDPRDSAPVQLGRHRVRTEGPVLILELNGPLHPPELTVMFEHVLRMHRAHGQLFLLALNDERASLPAVSRKMIAEFHRQHEIRSTTAAAGGSFLERALFQMVARAVQLIAKHQNITEFFATEAEARSWLSRQIAVRRPPSPTTTLTPTPPGRGRR